MTCSQYDTHWGWRNTNVYQSICQQVMWCQIPAGWCVFLSPLIQALIGVSFPILGSSITKPLFSETILKQNLFYIQLCCYLSWHPAKLPPNSTLRNSWDWPGQASTWGSKSVERPWVPWVLRRGYHLPLDKARGMTHVSGQHPCSLPIRGMLVTHRHISFQS